MFRRLCVFVYNYIRLWHAITSLTAPRVQVGRRASRNGSRHGARARAARARVLGPAPADRAKELSYYIDLYCIAYDTALCGMRHCSPGRAGDPQNRPPPSRLPWPRPPATISARMRRRLARPRRASPRTLTDLPTRAYGTMGRGRVRPLRRRQRACGLELERGCMCSDFSPHSKRMWWLFGALFGCCGADPQGSGASSFGRRAAWRHVLAVSCRVWCAQVSGIQRARGPKGPLQYLRYS